MKKITLLAILTAALPYAAAADTVSLSDHSGPSALSEKLPHPKLIPSNPLAGFEVGVGESILGHTLEAGYKINDRFGIRGMYGSSEYGLDRTISGNEFSGDLKLGGAGLFLDLYPTKGALRISAGAVKLDHELSASTSGAVSVGGQSYTTTLQANAKFKNEIAPAVTAGFSKNLFGTGLKLSGDIGAVYTGGIVLSAKDSNGIVSQAEIDREFKKEIDDMKNVKFAPFIKVGLSYAF